MLSLTIAGCAKNEEPKVPANPETPGTPTAPADRPIIFTTAIAATRSPQLEADGSGTFTAGDTFMLYAHDGNGASAALDYTIGATALYWREIAFAQEGERINLAACYPKQTLDKGGIRLHGDTVSGRRPASGHRKGGCGRFGTTGGIDVPACDAPFDGAGRDRG